TIVLSVPTGAGAAALQPAAIRLLSPTVTTTSASMSPARSPATCAWAVQAAVNSPTRGDGSPRRSPKASRRRATSSHGQCLSTCRLTIVRAWPSPPPCTAEDSTVSGAAAVTTTASSSISISTPSIVVISRSLLQSRPTSSQGVDAQRGEAAHLLILRVEHVLDPRREVQRLQVAPPLEDSPGSTQVDHRVPRIVKVAQGLELFGHDLGLPEQRQPLHRRATCLDTPCTRWKGDRPSPGSPVREPL